MKPILSLISILAMVGCADYSATSNEAGDAADFSADTGWASEGSASTDGDWSETEDLGSETENDFLRLRPATTDKYLFVANPARNTVTRITVPSLDVVTVDVGIDPSAVVTTNDFTRAVTFNRGSDDITVIDATIPEVEQTVTVLNNLNQMVVSPDGNWAIAFHNADAAEEGDSSGTISFNEISIVELNTGAHTPMVVGQNPHQIKFTDDSMSAVVISDDRLVIVDLSVGSPSRSIINISDDPLNPPRAEEVELTPDGHYAFIRQYGADEIVLVDLITELVYGLPVASNPTDLDISPDGSSAVIVDRGSQQLFIYPTTEPENAIPVIIDLPETELLGSIQFSPDNYQAILYTTVSDISHYTTWDLTEPDPELAMTVRPLVKPIQQLSVTPTGQSLMVLHDNGSSLDSNPAYDGKYAITLIDLYDFLDNPMILPAEPTAFANSLSGEVGYVIMEGVPQLTLLAYDALMHLDIELKSNPVHVGILPDTNYAYVNQEHDLGRLTFYDPVDPLNVTDDILQTITGFELNSAIEH
jgi:hypothetical protein